MDSGMNSGTFNTTMQLDCRRNRKRTTSTATKLLVVVALATCYSCCSGGSGGLVGRPVAAWSIVDRFTFGGSMFPENHRGGKQTPVRGRQRRRSRHLVTADDDDNNNNNNSPRRHPASRSNHQTQQDMMRFMDRPMTSTVGDWNNAGGSSSSTNTMLPEDFVDDALLELVHCIVRAADGRKADNIVALQVHHISTLASVLVILSGNSRPQNQAIAAAVTKAVAEQFDGQRPGGTRGVPEGSAESGWMLLDYGSVMVHVMTPKSRLFYNVEGQWKEKGGTYWDLSDILIPNTGAPSSSSLQLGDAFVAKEDDPFWS